MSDWKPLEGAIAIEPLMEQEFLSMDVEEAVYELKELDRALILVVVNGENDLRALLRFKEVFKRQLNTDFKFVIINFSRSSLIESKVQKTGLGESLEPGINSKALRLKLDRWINVLSRPKESGPNKDPSALRGSINWEDTVDNFDDFWVSREDKCKRILKRFSVKVFGPGPYVSKWIEVGKNSWRFEISEDSREEFLPLAGEWTFTGEARPEFVWQENMWLFVGEEMSLRYQNQSEGIEDYKFKVHEGSLLIKKNSRTALAREKKIVESFEKNVTMEKDKSRPVEDLKLQDLLREDIREKEARVGDENYRELSIELDRQENSKDFELRLDQGTENGINIDIDQSQQHRDLEFIKELEELLENEERYKFRKMCSSPLIDIRLSFDGEIYPAQFFDCDAESLYLQGSEMVPDDCKAGIRIKTNYYNHALELQLTGVTRVIQGLAGQRLIQVKIENAQKPSLMKFTAFLKLRKKIVYSFMRVSRN